MPFTLSHAAAALPFRRTKLMMSAVVVGCFAPDFEYFLGHHGSFGHRLPGMFLFDLPLGFLALWLFHRYAKEPLAACLPARARERFELGPKSLSIDSVSRFVLIAVSILIGIATHILWDSFTHTGYLPANTWPFLSRNVDLPIFGPRPWLEIFQYLSSIFGLAVILLWYIRWYRNTPPRHPRPKRTYLVSNRIAIGSAFLIALIAALLRAATDSGIPDGIHGSQRFMTQAAITGLAVFWAEVVVYGFIRNSAATQSEAA